MTDKPSFALHQWSGETDVLDKYAGLLSQVYNKTVSPTHLYWKHRDNPLGHSLITYAENSAGEMVAARAFWRMYSENTPIYQPCDTVTRPDFQRRGLFSSLTKMCLYVVESDAAIVNFPNNNSYPAYLKLGWQSYSQNKKVFGLGLNVFSKPIPDLISHIKSRVNEKRLAYLAWRFSDKSGIDYRFFTHSKGIVVCNGSMQGLVAFNCIESAYGKSMGVNIGYVSPKHFSAVKALLSGTVALACASKTAFLLMPNAEIQTLKNAFSLSQANVLMDTF